MLHFNPPLPRYKVVVLDFGVKYNILRSLRECGCEVIVLPATSTAESVLSHHPDGILLSNGPGDPEGLPMPLRHPSTSSGRNPSSASAWATSFWGWPGRKDV